MVQLSKNLDKLSQLKKEQSKKLDECLQLLQTDPYELPFAGVKEFSSRFLGHFKHQHLGLMQSMPKDSELVLNEIVDAQGASIKFFDKLYRELKQNRPFSFLANKTWTILLIDEQRLDKTEDSSFKNTIRKEENLNLIYSRYETQTLSEKINEELASCISFVYFSDIKRCPALKLRNPNETCGNYFVHYSEREKVYCSSRCASRAYQRRRYEKKKPKKSARRKSKKSKP